MTYYCSQCGAIHIINMQAIKLAGNALSKLDDYLLTLYTKQTHHHKNMSCLESEDQNILQMEMFLFHQKF